MANNPLNEQERARLEERVDELLGTNDQHERAKVLEDCEGRFDSVTSYVEQRLESELPATWRWLNAYVAHAAVGERWLVEKRIVVLTDSPGAGRSGLFVFIGKG